MTRSESRGSASAPSIALNTSDSNSTSSPTPATSNTDAASVSTDATPKIKTGGRSSERLRLIQSSIGIYNENILYGSDKYRRRKRRVEEDGRNTSDETLVNFNDTQERLVQESVQLLDRGWTLGAMPGENLKKSMEAERQPKRRQSTRLEILEKATDMVGKTKSILGKRGRETLESGMEIIQALKGNKRASSRPREVAIPSFEGPCIKRARLSDVANVKITTPSPSEIEVQAAKKPPTKRWLSQGLYVGQNQDFDARLPETQNKMRKASAKKTAGHQRRILPLPMFAGQRTIEIGRDFKLPFDIFSPLPPCQPKPEEWKKTHKNIFIAEAAAIWKKSKSLEASTCICTPENGCDEECFNRFMFYECDDSNCTIGSSHCTNRAFAGLKERTKNGSKYNIGVEVIKTVDRGHGVRSNRTFEPNQIIVEYTGEIITQDECDFRMDKRYKNAECYYLMDFDQQMILDATRGSIARFINHSCEPNCRMIKWTVAGKPRMALFAGDGGIMTGEELTYDYNFSPYSIKNVQECRCGAASCRGVLGPKPKEIKEALKPIATGGKRKFGQALQNAIENVTETITKRRKLDIPAKVKKGYAYILVASDEASEMVSKANTKLSKVRSLASSTAANERPVKKVSKRSLRGMHLTTTSEITKNKVKKHTTITYSRRRSSAGKLLKERNEKQDDSVAKGKDVDNEGADRENRIEKLQTPKAVKDKSTSSQKGGSKAAISIANKNVSSVMKTAVSVRKNAASMRKNAVTPLRRSSRGDGGKTVRVIGDED